MDYGRVSNYMLGSCQPSASGQWIHSFSDRHNDAFQLICFPYAGSGITPYRSWLAQFSSGINVSAVLLPGRESRFGDRLASDMDTVCSAIVGELVAQYHGCKLVLFGHSMGTAIAYEVARRLEMHHDWIPRGLVLSGREAPHVVSQNQLHLVSNQALITEIINMGQTSAELFEDQEMRSLLLPMIRSDYTLLENYHISTPTPLVCPLLTCVGDTDNKVNSDQMHVWRELILGRYLHQQFNGGHLYFLESSTVRNKLTSCIEKFIYDM